ncbi:amidohydrolase family protein [Wenzhouxiangella marina]|uniref:Amidohydrolase n=1 Tax=Wenzhouxiangella marina TaxID=1579979 RepID=A0A0K0XS36_9GAMM|nr:amidohydrolase family protein [Wenzhouxiangella marina]AKS40503.1 amidohydrolase [Wenzhouxiangella marina]MBB6088175.1 imidazolonepropionase-like amidohydrolase [Wenzhouxiangella marina]
MRTLQLLVGLAALTLTSSLMAQDLAVRAGTLHTGTGERHSPGVVLIRDGVIEAVGPADSIRIPEDIEVISVPVATPGLIDVRNVVGLAGAANQPHDQDQLESSAAIQPQLRALDAYNPRERLVGWLREHGITTIHTGHAPGEVISGQTLIAKTRGDTVDEAVLQPVFGLAATLGDQSTRHDRSTPGSRSKSVAMLRQELIRAQEYARQREDGEGSRDLSLEMLAQVLAGEHPLIVEVHKHSDIMTALRLADEFDFELMLSGASDAHLLIDEIREAGVPVLIHPTMMRARGPEVENFSFTTALRLQEAGIPVAIQGGYESYVPKARVVLWEAAMTLPYGASFDQALALITSAPAEILGLSDRIGSLEVGKDGDLALFDGDPFEYTTHVIGTIIEGERVSAESR